jgi:hypothetical protein
MLPLNSYRVRESYPFETENQLHYIYNFDFNLTGNIIPDNVVQENKPRSFSKLHYRTHFCEQNEHFFKNVKVNNARSICFQGIIIVVFIINGKKPSFSQSLPQKILSDL